MAMVEDGDFVLRCAAGDGRVRLVLNDRVFTILCTGNGKGNSHVMVADITEAHELRDWLESRLEK